MVIVKLMGGLGNQMFQYAAGLRLARRHGTGLKLDPSFLQDRSATTYTIRDFALSIFGLEDIVASPKEVEAFRSAIGPGRKSFNGFMGRKAARYHYREENLAFDGAVLDLPDEAYLEGFFQDERYFLDIEAEVRARFRIKLDQNTVAAETFQLAMEISRADSICMHVRRGDYVTNAAARQVSGICSTDYYLRGLAALRGRGAHGPVYMFSDDPEWCRTTFHDVKELTVVDDEHAGVGGANHFWLMTLCRHFVLSNSSFSWWAAWLSGGRNAIICRPLPWFNDPKYQAATVSPPYWIGIPR